MNEQVRLLSILHAAFVMSQLIFAGIVFYLIKSAQIEPIFTQRDWVDDVRSIAVGASLGIILTAFRLFKRKTNEIQSLALSIEDKLLLYRKAVIVRLAMVEATSMLFIVMALLTGKVQNIATAAVIIAVLIFIRPTKASIARQLMISEEELK